MSDGKDEEEVGYDTSDTATLGAFSSCHYDETDETAMEMYGEGPIRVDIDPAEDVSKHETSQEKGLLADSGVQDPDKQALGLNDGKMVDVQLHSETVKAGCLTAMTKPVQLKKSLKATPKGKNDLYGFGNMAFVTHYMTAGFLTSIVTGILFVQQVGVMALHTDRYATSLVVVIAPWGLRSFIGFMSDQLPICNYRRKPYQVLGWIIVSTGFVLLYALYTEPEPYYCFDSTVMEYDYQSVCNHDAAKDAGLLTLIFAIVTAGVVVSTSALDGLVVERSQNCPKYESPLLTTQALWLFGSFIGRLCIAIWFNDKRHMGFFVGFSMKLDTMLLICSVLAVSMIFFSICLSNAENMVPSRFFSMINREGMQSSHVGVQTCQTLKISIIRVCRMVTNVHVFKLCMFCLLASSALAFTSPVDWAVRRYWAKVLLFQQQIAWLVSDGLLAMIILIFKNTLMHANWRVLLCVTIPISTTTSMAIYAITSMNVFRNQYVFLVADFFDVLADSIVYCTSSMAAMALAPKHLEATMYNLVLTLHTLPTPLLRWSCNKFNDYLPSMLSGHYSDWASLSYNHNYIADLPTFRYWVLMSYAVSAVVTLLIVVTGILLLLPESKHEVSKLVINCDLQYSNRYTLVRGFVFMILCSAVLSVGIFLLFHGQEIKLRI
jgi:hypothetical protein